MHCMVQKINNSGATAAANCNAANVSVLQSHYPPENLWYGFYSIKKLFDHLFAVRV